MLKYLPRNGTILEGGCGLGRYVFYLSQLGLDVVGVDFSSRALRACRQFGRSENLLGADRFSQADVRDLPFPDNALAGYISLGVIEHLPNPGRVLREAHRTLRPGGTAVVSAPNASCFAHSVQKAYSRLKRVVRAEASKAAFETCSLERVSALCAEAGLEVVEATQLSFKRACYHLSFLIASRRPRLARAIESVNEKMFPALGRLDDTSLSKFGSTCLVVARKPGDMPHCFLCGSPTAATCDQTLTIPVCRRCADTTDPQLLSRYLRCRRSSIQYAETAYRRRAAAERREQADCQFCGRAFPVSRVFGDFGFAAWACPSCLRDPLINLRLSHFSLSHRWFVEEPVCADG